MLANDVRIVLFVMWAHYLSDFHLQTDWQARNKSSNYTALTRHVAIYTLAMAACVAWWLPTLPVALSWIAFTFASHWCTDWITSRGTSKLFKRGDFHNGFAVVGLDQYIHLACLMGATYWALR